MDYLKARSLVTRVRPTFGLRTDMNTASDSKAWQVAVRRCIDYRALPINGEEGKIMTLLLNAQSMGMSRADACAVVALQAIESKYDSWLPGSEFVSGTLYDEVFQENETNPCPCITIVGWEGGGGVGWQSWNNPEIKAYLTEKKYVDQPCDQGSLCAMKWTSGVFTGMPPSKNVISFFVDVVAKRWESLLNNFSVGGTQLWGANYFKNSGAPGSWEDIWDLLTGGPQANLKWTKRFNIETNPAGSLPITPSDEQGVAWLAKQTGTAKQSSGNTKNYDYWHGTGDFSQYVGGWKIKHAEVVALSSSINW